MDGNGRWAEQRGLPRAIGHRAGLKAARAAIEFAAKNAIEVLTLFAFSSENWRRPKKEVNTIFQLFLDALQSDIEQLHQNNIQLRIIGERSSLSVALQTSIQSAEKLTANNTGLKLVIAVNYGGRWDITQAVRKIAVQVASQQLPAEAVTEESIHQALSLHALPNPDLFIRSSGEQRVSNFFLWQLAYSELYFPECYWPDFDEDVFQQALDFYSKKQRRFGCTSKQIKRQHYA
jgi:undecaprenyl diphosphate synthase